MPRVVDHTERRRELARAVWGLIRRDGLRGVTIRRVADASGWSSGAVRHYLPNHRAILDFAADELLRVGEDHLRAIELVDDPAENLRRFLMALLPVTPARQEWMGVWLAFAADAVGGGPATDRMDMLYADLHEVLVEVTGDLHRAGRLAGEPEAVATTWHALADGLAVHLLLGRVTEAEAEATVRAAISAALRSPA